MYLLADLELLAIRPEEELPEVEPDAILDDLEEVLRGFDTVDDLDVLTLRATYRSDLVA